MNLTLDLTEGQMGIWLTPRNCKWSDEHERKLSELRDAFHPFCNSRSATVRVIIDLMHTLVFTPGIIEKLNVLLQGTSCALFVRTHEFSAPHRHAEKPGPVRMETEGKPRRSSVNSTYRVTASAGWEVLSRPAKGRMDRTSWRTPFCGSLRGRVAV